MVPRNQGGQCIIEVALIGLILASLIIYLMAMGEQTRPLLTRLQLSNEEVK